MNEQKFQKDLNLFMKSQGISNSQQYYANKRLENNMTPYILEERQLNVTQMDVFSRMMMERIIWLTGTVDEQMQIIGQAQLMYLDSIDNKDITLQIVTNGGSIHSGNSLIDVMNYISCDVSTINMGMCASMGAVLLGAGTVGKRLSLPSSKTMIHQSSSGVQGKYTEVLAEIEEWKKVQHELFEKLGSYCGKTGDQIMEDCPLDTWFTAQEIMDYGLIDGIIKNKPKNK